MSIATKFVKWKVPALATLKSCKAYQLREQLNNGEKLSRAEKFLDEKFFDCYLERSEDYVDGEFYSKWDFPEALINEMIESLEDKQGIYIRVLTHELCNEYVSFRIFSQGEWDIRY